MAHIMSTVYVLSIKNGTNASLRYIDPHTLTSLGGYVTIFSDETTLKMAAEPVI